VAAKMTPRASPAGSRTRHWVLAAGGALSVVVIKLIFVAIAAIREPRQVAILCSLREFKQEPAPNQANNRLIYAQDTADGMGVYYWEASTHQARLLGEQKERGSHWMRLGMLGWSPGDKWFACALPKDQQDEQWVQIFDGQTGAAATRVGVERGLNQLAWLSNEAFAYATPTIVRTVGRQPDGSWTHQRNYQNAAKKLEDLTALSASVVAWRDEGRVYLLDVNAGQPRELWHATTNELVQLTRGRNGEELLLNCRDATGQSLLRLHLDGTISPEVETLGGPGDLVHDVGWQDGGSAYAFLTNDPAGCALAVKLPESRGVKLIPWRGGAQRLVRNGSRLLFYGYQDGEFPGVWECDPRAGSFQRLVAAADKTSKAGSGRPATTALLTNRLGQTRSYHVWTPPGFAPGRKYPLLLAQEMSAWFAGFQIANRLGYMVAVADRPFAHTWDGDLPHTWAEDVRALYELMAKHPGVDTNRVYLYACSRDTSGLTELVAEQPALAKGLICFSPSALPDSARLRDKTVLLTSGADAGDSQRLREFQDRATQNGNVVTLLLQPHSQHMPASGDTAERLNQQLARYLRQQD
jgi:hypothetical protein